MSKDTNDAISASQRAAADLDAKEKIITDLQKRIGDLERELNKGRSIFKSALDWINQRGQ